jgi:pimeloyl-ACP methyl ester carboxylesterase
MQNLIFGEERHMRFERGERVKRDEHLISKYVTVRGHPLHYRVSASTVPTDGEVIVLLHGLVVSCRYMQPTARLLAPAYHVLTPDLPGFGKSKGFAHVPDLAELADILAEWMAALGLRRANFLGNSVGCQILIQLALRHPTLVQRLILTAPTMDPQARTIPRELVRWLKNVPFEPPSLFAIVLRDYLDIGFRRTLATLRSSLRDPVERHLPHIQAPALVVRGTRDFVVSQQWAEEVARLLPRGELVVLQGAAHDVNYNSAADLAKVIHDFITQPAVGPRETLVPPR